PSVCLAAVVAGACAKASADTSSTLNGAKIRVVMDFNIIAPKKKKPVRYRTGFAKNTLSRFSRIQGSQTKLHNPAPAS
ncbi:MAG: hypothetical protein JNN20_04205, partial [Betaproteobacteria bacterium]|nr:hypothetical protein [Betaproteobacteria bacterium]